MKLDAERCEAALEDGRRCPNGWTVGVRNPGAYMPYRVCGIHKRQGEASVARDGLVPSVWAYYWKRWVA